MTDLTILQRVRLTRVRKQIESGERDELAFDQRERDWLQFIRYMWEGGCDCGLGRDDDCDCDDVDVNRIAH